MRKLEQKRKLNNGGFSLVELIIVIAIMVVLVGVLAPTYLRYVEKSRVSADASTMDEFVNVMQTVASDPDINLDTTKTYTVERDATDTSKINVSSDLQTVLTGNGLMTSDDCTNSKLQSTEYKTATNCKVELSYDSTNKVWTVTKNLP